MSRVGHRYDTKLAMYQGLLEIPIQVAMYDIYKKLEPNTTTYASMALLNAGAWFLNQKLSANVYNSMHSTSPSQNTDYYVSFLTEYNYNHLQENKKNIPISEQNEYTRNVDSILRQAPAYTNSVFDLQIGAYVLKSTYGALVKYNQSKSVLGALAYGLTQPLAVVVKDSRMLK